MPASAFLPYAPLPARRHRARRLAVCAATRAPPPEKAREREEAVSAALPLARTETAALLQRMLALAVADQDFARAASLRDAAAALREQHPTYALRVALRAAVDSQDFGRAAALRDEVARVDMLVAAERSKPRFPLGLVVVHRRMGYRMVLFGADFRCRAPARKAEDMGVSFCHRGEDQPWYHAAVDERDKTVGDNIVYVAEDDCLPAPFGETVIHPITRIMFRGVYGRELCPDYSWYVSAAIADGSVPMEAEEVDGGEYGLGYGGMEEEV